MQRWALGHEFADLATRRRDNPSSCSKLIGRNQPPNTEPDPVRFRTRANRDFVFTSTHFSSTK